MRKVIVLSLIFFLVFSNLCAQKVFNEINIGSNDGESIPCIVQDHLGYIWFGKVGKGLIKYDGSKFITYAHDDKDTNSITGARPEAIAVDSFNNIWLGTLGGGMDMFGPSTNSFKHFRHHANDPGSLSHDTVTAILEDHLGNLWIGTSVGLDMYDNKTTKFIHYTHKANDANSLSGTHVRAIYEDREGNLWVGCGSPWPNEESWKDEGGLNKFDRATGNFTSFVHNANDENSIANNKVRALLEDSEGNFWVGTGGDGLQTLNRQTGKFTHYYYDSTHPEKLSRGPYNKNFPQDQVEFIKEDANGRIWIGTLGQGIVEYNLQTKKIIHHGYIFLPSSTTADTLTGFNAFAAWAACSSKDGLLWITTGFGHLFEVNANKKPVIPYAKTNGAIAFYKEADGIVWISTDSGMLRKDGKTGKEKLFVHDKNNSNSVSNNYLYTIIPGAGDMLWIATAGSGVERLDPRKNTFIHYMHNSKNASLAKGVFGAFYFDSAGYLWIGTENDGLIKLDTATGKFVHFKHDVGNSASLIDDRIYPIAGNKTAIWVGTYLGLDKIEPASGKIEHYLRDNLIVSVLIDSKGVVWTGTSSGLYSYNAAKNNFMLFDDPDIKIGNIISLAEDKKNNIWISTANAVFEISKDRKNVRIYNADNGAHTNAYTFCLDYVSPDGEIFMGDQSGYYHFYPDSIKEDVRPPYLNIASFQIAGKEIASSNQYLLNKPLYNADEIKLPNDKSSFSLAFSAIDFLTNGEKRIIYRLDNYDSQWHETNADKRAYFYNLPSGNYTLKVRAINAAGARAEKTLSIVITPPWWQTLWAISIFIIVLIAIVLGYSYYRSAQLRKTNRLLEEKVARRTAQLKQSIEELKATQNQLIQSEKMASLGELTAGIAHEIQNPLNFVNNFSEVNKELIDEMQQEMDKGNLTDAKSISNEIKDNEQKINHHGKRADAIVKGMLQHSRSSTGVKEPTDINALADEYIRLSYHGLRAKDKDFNAELKTDFDNAIGKINIIPQDIGRVLLNLYNNAFYAVNERFKAEGLGFEPTVSVSTKKSGNQVSISVRDNGNGIPKNIVDKIFQPFFTTKPTGQGTGLGLSLSYDIIKAHGGEIKVESKEGEGSEFIILLPLNNNV